MNSPKKREQQTISSPAGDSLTRFGRIFNDSYELLRRNFWMLAALMSLYAAGQFLADIYLDTGSYQTGVMSGPKDNTYITAAVFFGILMMLTDYLGSGGAIGYIATLKREGKKLSFTEAVNYAFNRLKEAVILALRIFLYTYAWLLFVIMAGIVIPAVLTGIMGTNEFLEIISSPAVRTVLILAFFTVVVLVIIRSLKVVFAYPVLMSDPKMDSRRALNNSIRLTSGMLWRIFANYFILGLIFGIIGGIYGGLIATLALQITGAGFYMSPDEAFQVNILAGLLTVPFIIAVRAMAVMFQYVFMVNAVDEKNFKLD